MSCVENLAAFVCRSGYEDLSEAAREQLKIRVLDSLGCAVGAMEGEPVQILRRHIGEFESQGPCTLIGGVYAAADSAAFYDGTLVRYLDFNDAYLAKDETCHPSDNLAAILAGAEYADRTGRDLMAALAIAYQVQCRLSDIAPVRDKGFDHTTQGAYSVAAGLSKILELDERQTANAIAIAGTAFNALRVTRTGHLSHWKGLAFPNTAACVTRIVFLARDGITGPLEIFEGDKGFMDAIAGVFDINWLREDLERVKRTILKRFNAEIHSQSAIQGALDLKHGYQFGAADIERIEIEIFDVAYKIIGGGEEGDKTSSVTTKEQADHSLPYVIAVAILDGDVMPVQYVPQRIRRNDVQSLLRRVSISPNAAYSQRFPEEMPCRLRITLRDGRILTKENRDYPGSISQPMSWEAVSKKFHGLAARYCADAERNRIVNAIADLENLRIRDLMRLLAGVSTRFTVGSTEHD
ncbi:MAG TPA: MmgE/PrpD family protein [Bryobacteraceae bacterium]|nr:MmgE/PrpD family protein [Bryobacteraceae bacterium]